MFLKIFYGVLMFLFGVAIIKYRKQIYDWTGRFGWAEHYLGSGGTVIVITLMGMFFIFLSIAYPAGVFEIDRNITGKNNFGGMQRINE